MSLKYSENNDFDDFMQSNEENEGSLTENGNIVNVLDSMNIISDEERENIRKNVQNSIFSESGDGDYVESGWEYYGFMFLNIVVFMSFGKKSDT